LKTVGNWNQRKQHSAIANVFGLSDLKKKHRITFDSEKEDAFTVHMDEGNMKFKCNPKGLYTFEVSDSYLKMESHLINTVKENRVGYTQRQFEQAKKAKENYIILWEHIQLKHSRRYSR
jgi:hypothetical protein